MTPKNLSTQNAGKGLLEGVVLSDGLLMSQKAIKTVSTVPATGTRSREKYCLGMLKMGEGGLETNLGNT